MLAILALTGCTAPAERDRAAAGPAWQFVSRPDLTPPVVTVAGRVPPSAGDLVFLGPKGDGVPLTGVLIVDGAGRPVYVRPTGGNVNDVRVQRYRGAPVLTYWRAAEGALNTPGHGSGEVVVLDSRYRQVATVTTGGDLGPGKADLHETRITDAGTMLLVAYVPERADLTAVGGPAAGWVYDGVVQEVDIATGAVVFEWSALDHVPLTDSVQPLRDGAGTRQDPYDWFHINSVAEDADGSLLVSARNTSAVYDVDRATGAVRWTLGGRSSDFTMAAGASFAWQHDAERQPDGTLTLYDNESEPAALDHSRGLRLSLDMATRTARVVTEYLPPDGRRSSSQGSVEVLDDGTVLVGWGSEPQYSLFAADGTLLADADLGGSTSYRAYAGAWTGLPEDPPDLVVRTAAGTTTAYVSWNGATEVRSWRLLAGAGGVSATPVRTVDRDGFETSFEVPAGARYVVVEALAADGRVLGSAGTPVAP